MRPNVALALAACLTVAALAGTVIAVTPPEPASAPEHAVPPGNPAQPPPENQMRTWYIAFLKRGPAWKPGSTPEVQRLQEAHMANIHQMWRDGKLLVAGPFTDDGDLRGLFIFTVASLEEAKALAEADPMVKAGRLQADVHPWYAARDIRVEWHEPSPAPDH